MSGMLIACKKKENGTQQNQKPSKQQGVDGEELELPETDFEDNEVIEDANTGESSKEDNEVNQGENPSADGNHSGEGATNDAVDDSTEDAGTDGGDDSSEGPITLPPVKLEY